MNRQQRVHGEVTEVYTPGRGVRPKHEEKTNSELVAMKDAIVAAPENRMPTGQFWLYTPAARKKLDKIDRQITANLRNARLLIGDTINDDGYSGRQMNRRR